VFSHIDEERLNSRRCWRRDILLMNIHALLLAVSRACFIAGGCQRHRERGTNKCFAASSADWRWRRSRRRCLLTHATTFISSNLAHYNSLCCSFLFPQLTKTPILGQEVPKIHANINNPISDLNVRELLNFNTPHRKKQVTRERLVVIFSTMWFHCTYAKNI